MLAASCRPAFVFRGKSGERAWGHAKGSTSTVTVEVDQECMELLTKAQALAGVPVKAEAIKRALKEFVRRRSPEERTKR